MNILKVYKLCGVIFEIFPQFAESLLGSFQNYQSEWLFVAAPSV
jgi:hypothetical protein